MRPGSPLRLQPLPPSETTHAAPTTPWPRPTGVRRWRRDPRWPLGNQPASIPEPPAVALSALSWTAGTPPSRPGRKAHICCLSGGTDGVSRRSGRTPSGPRTPRRTPVAGRYAASEAARADTPRRPGLNLPTPAFSLLLCATGRPTEESIFGPGRSRSPFSRLPPASREIRCRPRQVANVNGVIYTIQTERSAIRSCEFFSAEGGGWRCQHPSAPTRRSALLNPPSHPFEAIPSASVSWKSQYASRSRLAS